MRSKKEPEGIRKELEDLAPGLAQLKANEKLPDIPVHYFEELPDQVFQRIRAAQAAPAHRHEGRWWPQLWQLIRQVFAQPAYAVGLAGLALVVIALGVLHRAHNSAAGDAVALSDEDILKYIDYHIDDFDLGLLMEGDDQGYLEEEEAALPAEDSLEQGDLEDYLEELLDEVGLEELL